MPQIVKAKRSTNLDVVRGVAILAVVAVHTFQANVSIFPETVMPESSLVFVLMSYLRFGVELFYLLSGWLMYSIYRRSRKETGKQYFFKRFARIWPLWLVFTVLSFVSLVLNWQYSPVASRFEGSTWIQWVLALLVVLLFLGWIDEGLWNVPAGGWSIQVEIGHYSIFWFMRKSRDLTLLVTVFIGYATYFLAEALFGMYPGTWIDSAAESWLRLGLYGTWPFFVAGGLAFIWFGKDDAGKRAIADISRPGIIGRAGVVVAIVIIARWVPVPFGMTYEALLTCLVLLALVWLMTKWIQTVRAGVILGRYSYFIYFAHFWVLEFVLLWAGNFTGLINIDGVFGFWFSYFVMYAVALGISLALAVPSWKYFESRWINKSHTVSP